tara:strand:- start:17 stop:361 length:345 start_codon:yes stop_codon:yes gene_type:complete
MKINFNAEDSKVIKSNETYDVIDNTNLKNLIVSKTILHPKKNTSGHNHSGQEEVYVFIWGNGKMRVDDKTYIIGEGDVILIPDGAFHKVWNQDELLDMEFICVFNGGRNHESNG